MCEEQILYDLIVHEEWKQEPQLLVRTKIIINMKLLSYNHPILYLIKYF